jgi:biotin carboxyl carrier protein
MQWQVRLGDKTFVVNLADPLSERPFHIDVNGKTYRGRWNPMNKTLSISLPGKSAEQNLKLRSFSRGRFAGDSHATLQLEVSGVIGAKPLNSSAQVEPFTASNQNRKSLQAAKGNTVRSPMTGKIVNILVKGGDQVETGQTLAVIEAMKMENKIFATVAGKVEGIKVKAGDPVMVGAELMKLV